MFRSLAVVALCVWLAMTSCTAGAVAVPATARQLTAQEQSDLKYLVQRIGARERGAVDLSDARSRAAYVALLARHGITPDSRPYLFQTLDALASAKEPVDTNLCQLPAAGEGPQNLRVILDATGNEDFSEVRAEALDSLVLHPESTPTDSDPGSPQFVFDSLDVYDSTVENLLTFGDVEKHVGVKGSTFDPRFNVFQTPLGANPTKKSVVVVASFYYRTARGAHVPCIVVNSGLDHFMPTDMDLADPTNQTTPPGSPIVICINRQNQSGDYTDCDYGPLMPGVGNPQAHVKAVVSGSVTYYDPIAPLGPGTPDTSANPDGYLEVIPRQTGGACGLSKITGADFLSHFKIASPYKLEFDWGRTENGTIDPAKAADFGPLCWNVVPNNSEWDFLLSLKTTTLNKLEKPTYKVSAAFVSDDPAILHGLKNIRLIPSLVMQFGCIEEGAMVTMEGGAQEAIEDVRIGQRVLGANGTVFKVTKKTTGTDNHFVALSFDSKHRALFVTPTHPVAIVGQHGADSTQLVKFVPAKDLVKGDRIDVAGASAPVAIAKVEAKTLDQAARVFNLTLEPVEQAGGARAPSDRSFYANDILVGDNAMQGRLMAEAQAAAARVPTREITGEERVDYEKWMQSREQAAGGQLKRSNGD